MQCPSCGAEVPEGAQRCPRCSHRLAGGAASSVQLAQAAALCSGVGLLVLVLLFTPLRQQLPVGFMILLVPLGALFGIIFGSVSLARGRHSPGGHARPLAIVSLVLGVVLLVGLFVKLFIAMSLWSWSFA